MIPNLVEINNSPWHVLPSGVHQTTIAEIKNTFTYNPHRRMLFVGLVDAARALSLAGCKYLYIDGSYVTGKPKPGDFDGCWDPSGVNPSNLDPVLLDFDNGRKNQKLKFKGELFPFSSEAEPGRTFLEFFQKDRFTGSPKGILSVDLASESFDLIEGDKS
jgi:hypothetical protein